MAQIDEAIAALKAEIAQVVEPVAKVVSVDEYGPCLEWSTHWVELIGAQLYTAPQEPAVNAELLEALMELVANQDLTWRLAGFTEEQIQAMPYLKASRAAITKAGGAA